MLVKMYISNLRPALNLRRNVFIEKVAERRRPSFAHERGELGRAFTSSLCNVSLSRCVKVTVTVRMPEEDAVIFI